ncbi:MAG: M23 family metallopeptidase [bacterium]
MRKVLLVISLALLILVGLNVYRISKVQSSSATSDKTVSIAHITTSEVIVNSESKASSVSSSRVSSESSKVTVKNVVSMSSTSASNGKYLYPLDTDSCKEVTYVRGYSLSHRGVDLTSTANEKCKLLATADGEVIQARWTTNGSGYQVQIQLSDNIVVQYSNLSKIIVNEGQRVNKSDLIAYMGNTGEAFGTHLHFSVYENNQSIDPAKIIKFR